MLLAGGQCQHEAALALRINGFTAQTARHLADMFGIADCEQAQIRPAKLQADTD